MSKTITEAQFQTEPRFWTKVDLGAIEECWPWLGNRAPNGYGRYWSEGRTGPAHRRAWELLHQRPFPDGLEATHHCDNPPCANPWHIFPATHRENFQDALVKGRLNPYGSVGMLTCRAGHAYAEVGVRWAKAGYRMCLACESAANKRKHARRKARRAQDD